MLNQAVMEEREREREIGREILLNYCVIMNKHGISNKLAINPVVTSLNA